jgi:hypothetical protein
VALEVGAGIGKVAGLVARPILKAVGSQISRRDAQSILDADPTLLDAEIAEAISVLRRSGETLGSQIWISAKAVISDPPIIFDDQAAKDWLGRADVEALLGRATLALLARQSLDPHVAEAKALFGGANEGEDWYGAPLFDYAIAFIALSLKAKIDTGTKVILAAGAAQHEEVREGLADIRGEVLKNKEILERLASAADPATDAIDKFIDAEVDRLDAYRSIVDNDAVPALMKQAERALSGNLAGASPRARSKLYRFVAATQSREGDPDEADKWLGHAADLGVDDLATDRARIALARNEPDAAIALVGAATDRLSNSLRIEAINKRDGPEEAIAYFEAHSGPEQVTGYFMTSLALWLAKVRNAEAGEALLAIATPSQLEENKALRFVRMRMRLALLAPQPTQADVIQNHSLLPAPATLRNDAVGRKVNAEARADAAQLLEDVKSHPNAYFAELVELTRQYLCLVSGDPAVVETSKAEIAAYMADPNSRTTYVPLATLFGIDFDRQALNAQLDQAARLGPWDNMQLRAAFDLAVNSKDPDQIAGFVDRHRERLAEVVGIRQSLGIAIEALATVGRGSEARERLAAIADSLPSDDVTFLSDLISESSGEGSPDMHLARYEATGDEQDLSITVQSMRAKGDGRLPDYAYKLWQLRCRVEDAVVAANAFAWFGRDIDLRDLLAELGETVRLDPALETHLAWIRYREGDLAASEEIVHRLRAADPDSASLRQLRINLSIEAGEWHGLGDLFKEDLQRSEHRTSEQLLQAAALATASRNPDGKALVEAATGNADQNAQIYMSAFELALRRGEDLEEAPVGWLNSAIEYSGDEGPLQPLSSQDIIAARDERLEHIATVDRMMLSSELTLAQAAKPLGTTLPAMILAHSVENERMTDARRRFYLPLFAGNRDMAGLEGGGRVAIEPTALLTLHHLGLLPEALSAFDTIVLGSGTLPSLFENLMFGDRGQPSRAVRAQEVLRLLNAGRLSIAAENAAAGDKDARLFALAEELDGAFVHIPPIYVAGSLGEKVRDPEPFASRLTSVGGIVAALEARGEISAAEAERARRFPSVRKLWPDEGPADLSKPLILDAVALHYLIDGGVMAALERLGTPMTILSETIDSARGEIAEQQSNDALKTAIDRVRATLNGAIRSGKAEICSSLRRRASQPPKGIGPTGAEEKTDGGDTEDIAEDQDHDLDENDLDVLPLAALLKNTADASWLVADDRLVNQHAESRDEDMRISRVATTLDILAWLEKSGAITAQRRDTAIRRLRESGMGLVPVTQEEIIAAASEGDWSHGPSRSLRTLRDSILLPILRKSVLIPQERHWIEQTVYAVTIAIKDLFGILPADRAEQAATFLFGLLPDVRAVASIDLSPEARLWSDAIAVGAHALLATPIALQDDALDRYFEWYERAPLEQLQGRDAALFDALLVRLKHLLLTHQPNLDLPAGMPAPTQVEIARWMFAHYPMPLRLALVADAEVRTALERVRVITMGGAQIAQPDVIRFLSDVANDRAAELRDTKGNVLVEGGTMHLDGSVTTSGEGRNWRFAQAGLHSPDSAIRLSVIEDFFSRYTFAPSREAYWRDRAESEALDAEGFHALSRDTHHSPEQFVEEMVAAMAGEDFEIQTLAERSEAQFLALAETASDQTSLDDMLSSLAAKRRAGARPLVTAQSSATLAVAPGFRMEEFTGPLSTQDSVALAADLLNHGDPFSLLAAFELVAAHPADPACVELGDLILASLWGDEGTVAQLTSDFCVATIVTMVMTRWRGVMESWPIAGRRLACLAHAGVICRVFGHYQTQQPELLEQVRGWFGPRFRMAGLLEIGEARGWSSRMLLPGAVEGMLLRRFDAVLDRIAEAERPASWTALLEKGVANAGGQENLFLRLPGPLDEFSAAGFKRPRMEADELATLLPEFEVPPSRHCADMIFRMSALFDPPASDVEALTDAILAQARAADDELRETYQLVSLQLAAMWGLPDLAEGLATLLPRDALRGSAAVDHALSIAAAHPDDITRKIALESHLMGHALAVETGNRAALLANAIAVLINGSPRLGNLLHPARVASEMAI